MKKTVIIIEDETCVCCGKPAKLGQMVCEDCKTGRTPRLEVSAKYKSNKIIRKIKERFSK